MADRVFEVYPGETLKVVVPESENPNSFDELSELVRTDSGISIKTRKGREVHLCHSDEAGGVAEALLRISGMDKFYELKWNPAEYRRKEILKKLLGEDN
jgi:hypothetical protein